ncbi:MAG: sulfatase-like hydrolase/transferase [Bacteroidota bacterium]
MSKAKIKYLLWWMVPVAIAFLFELFFTDFRAERLINLAENIVFAAGIIVFFHFFKSPRIHYLQLLFYMLFSLSCALESIYFNWFGTNFSASAIFVLFETNTAEAREFLAFYFEWKVILFLLIYLLLILAFHVKNKITKLKELSFRGRWKLFFGFILLLAIFKFSKLIDQNFPYLVGRSIIIYQYEHFKLKELTIDQPEGKLNNVAHQSTEKEHTYVLVLGESTTKNHMGIYSYPRNTTPKLSAIKSELDVFTKVKSPHAYTIGSLKKALTINNLEQENETSIIQLMNQAGFKTFWLSNQRPIGPYESLVTKISRAADQYIYTNTAIAGSVTPHDEILLPHFESALKDPANKKFIVVHLLGTHLQYKDRYPKEFQFFEDDFELEINHQEALQKRNEYDNAIFYNDFLIDKMIGKTSKLNGNKWLIYFSDHGEEVYDTTDFAGHYEDNQTPNMIEIPFIVYRNNFDKKVPKINQSYDLTDFFHTLSDLSGIYFDGFQADKSLYQESTSSTNNSREANENR